MKRLLSSAPPGNPYLAGNWAPVRRELRPTPCVVVEGAVPLSLQGGQYVRNGGNPLKHDDEFPGRDSHWFDGDGMLTGVLFPQQDDSRRPPHFLNRYILTDVLLNTSKNLRAPLIPSISTFAASLTLFNALHLAYELFRAVVLALLSWLPFQRGNTPLKRISVANTSVYWHDGRAFASCESGPPIRILLPGLETADWWTGRDEESDGKGWNSGVGPLQMLNEFTTAHPRVDPVSGELLLYHMSFMAPFLRISVIPARGDSLTPAPLFGAPVPGMSRPKLAHDFAATRTRTILIDLPLVLDPRNLIRGKPMLSYEPALRTRFGVLPRREPGKVRWYESEACCVYHTANAWDEEEGGASLLACRLNSATLVYAAGNMSPPSHAVAESGIERCQLYYWQFDGVPSSSAPSRARYEFALSHIPFEFPTMNERRSMRPNRYVYGATMSSGTFDAGLGTRTAKIDCIAKIDVHALVAEGKRRTDAGELQGGQSVDTRSVREVLDKPRSNGGHVRVFALPPHHYAQEATFVPRSSDPDADEDDGHLLFFVFDESRGLDARTGNALPNARSELWVLDARSMEHVVCRVQLPQRVPYGLHGRFFAKKEIEGQRAVRVEEVRNWAKGAKEGKRNVGRVEEEGNGLGEQLVRSLRSSIEGLLA